jgi:hypothetical protein
MKLNNISPGEFIALLEKAKGNVYLDTGDGVYFNLNSKLSQLYCIRMLLDSSEGTAMSPEIKVEDERDEQMFQQYFVKQHIKAGNYKR